MDNVILQSGLLILCGVAWRILRPQGLDADALRLNLTGLVYHLLLPALVLKVLWLAPIGLDTLRIALLANAAVLLGMGACWLLLRLLPVARPIQGALLLASAFPNATYLGLPVLESVLGPDGRHIAIQFDLFACTPLLLTLGILVAVRYGEGNTQPSLFKSLLRVPPLWAALAAVLLNLLHLPMPALIDGPLELLGGGVIPLMLFSLGLGLRWSSQWRRYILLALPILVIVLLLTPFLVWQLAELVGLMGAARIGVVLEAAMPSMVLGIVLCDRYRLDTTLYAILVTLTTAGSLITLPLWYGWLL